MNPVSSLISQTTEPFQITTMDIVNWVLVLVVCLFLYQLLHEMLFRQRGKFCTECGMRDLPRNWATCESCGTTLRDYVESVAPYARRVAYAIPAISLLTAMVAYRYLGRTSQGGPMVVLGFIVLNSVFAQLWLLHRDRRLRTMFNVPFWGGVAGVLVVTAFDLLLRVSVGSVGGQGFLSVSDMEIGPEGTVCIALRDGSLCNGVGLSAYPFLRSVPIKRLLRSGTGDVFVFSESSRIDAPDGLIGATGIDWHPTKARVETGVKLLLGTARLSPEHRSLVDRTTRQANVNFCVDGDRVWVIDGQRLFRIQADGTSDAVSVGSRAAGRLIKVGPGKRMLWLLSSEGLTGIYASSERKVWYPLAEYLVRGGQKRAEIVAGAIGETEVWFATSNNDVMRFDLKKEQLTFEGVAQCPRYLDFYNLYTLPFLMLALAWTMSANFRVETK